MPGMNQGMGELAIIGQNQQAFAIAIQPPHGKQALFRIGNEVPEGPTLPGITTGTQHVPGLVEKIIFQSLCPDRMAIKQNLILIGIDAMPLRGMRVAINLNPALGDELLTGPPGPHSALRQIFLEANLIGRPWFWGGQVHDPPLSIFRAS
jgi:hypothetical protein